jgi:two-component system response regulator WspF
MRVAIAHASEALAGALGAAVTSVPGWRVAWRAASPGAAVERCAADRPDVLLLQARPDVAGATRRIMQATPCAIVLVVDDQQAEAGRVFEAMGAGAIDAVRAPAVDAGGWLGGTWEVIDKLHVAARMARSVAASGPQEPRAVSAAVNLPPLVLIGASTGGPAALARVLGALPAGYRGAVVVVQHVAAEFCGELARWLSGQVRLPVRTAARGDRPQASHVLLAGGHDNLVLTRDLDLTYRRPARHSYYHPSVDVFFKSVAAHWPAPGMAVLLTGIGRDGAEGLLTLRTARWTTIAQDESTSVVYGMPKAAMERRAAVHILPLDQIGPLLGRFAATPPGARRSARD